ncbi:hypothetical protein [Nocardia nova]|uniref:hypothetical protein n=1 Tax=Nocardia nova TaxID=37330 RepID=UPI001CA5DF10|nr:hypothetical protein [Nocardia nova]
MLGGWNAFITNLIASALHMLANLLGEVPVIGDTLEDIVDGIANFINDTHTVATTAGSNATAALSAATSALGTANSASSAASDAANIAAAAQETADKAYANAQYWKDEFSVSASAITYGPNDEVLGMFMDVPPGKIRKITAVNYRLLSNNSTLTINLVKKDINANVSVIWTSNIPSAATSYRDNGPDITVNDRDYVYCDVTAIGGTATALHCALIGVLIDA